MPGESAAQIAEAATVACPAGRVVAITIAAYGLLSRSTTGANQFNWNTCACRVRAMRRNLNEVGRLALCSNNKAISRFSVGWLPLTVKW
jgi:hypothetical protein